MKEKGEGPKGGESLRDEGLPGDLHTHSIHRPHEEGKIAEERATFEDQAAVPGPDALSMTIL